MTARRSGAALAATALVLAGATGPAAAAPSPSTAWRQGRFHVDVPGVVGRSDVVLGQPNRDPLQAMPLGNGGLGAAVWSANGLTAQLNRADTLPDRLSPGQLAIPGLAALTDAADYHGRLDLYNGAFVESGGGMTATAYVSAARDELVVDVTGADPAVAQTARLGLWQPRTPSAQAVGGIGSLSQTWTDTGRPGSGGETFGAMAAVTASARDVRATVVDPLTVQVAFRPRPDGSYRVVVASPQWTGGDPIGAAARLLAPDTRGPGRVAPAAQRRWWHDYWAHIGLIRLSSPDGTAEYLENLRTINLYANAAERGTVRPGSQAGVADLFDSTQDAHNWDPASYWNWNLRMLVTANLGAGAFGNNDAYFHMFSGDLPTIKGWTASQFSGLDGACVPETMRFNGVGQQVHLSNGQWGANPYLDCSAQGPANYNARTLSTGGEVSLFIWETYLATDDIGFLRRNYPVMAEWAQFMLAYAKLGTDGKLHTAPSNAHETQWDVSDPATDITAMTAVFPAVIRAARLLHRDAGLVGQLTAALPEILPYPRTDAATRTQQLPPSADSTGADVLGFSYQQAAPLHNVENLGLEPVWPYGLIGDSGALSDLAKRTFTTRPFVERNDWSLDPIDAARLGLPDDLRKTLVDLTQQYQRRPSGLAAFGDKYPEPYAEQGGVVTTALQDALVQDYDGVLRVAPSWPAGWDADATVYIQHNGRVDVQVRDGVPVTVALQAGADGPVAVRNPWPGQRVQVVTGDPGRPRLVVPPTSADRLTVPACAGHGYLIEPVAAPSTALPYAPVTGTPATSYKQLGAATIGLPPAA
ncbi:glycosyl hydrolase family 95 catalytic domain-containing protein [Actinoplanes subtropicus]|uniref:glycosyl hydrolase family 95 catalytic domain-containing protein n=1 Tax=Actinoplanes subtropicus TaxID=543632 RepID=UPI0004C353C3|nr:glycoside hydrolase [Actinoplanes subtropicus]